MLKPGDVPGPSFPPPGEWLAVDRVDRVLVRGRGLSPSLAGALGSFLILAVFWAGFRLCDNHPLAWAGVIVLLVLLFMANRLALEEIDAAPRSLEIRRRSLFGRSVAKFPDKPEGLAVPEDFSTLLRGAHLLAELGEMRVRFGRSLAREERDWLLLRLADLWDLEQPAAPRPPREE